MNTQTSSGGEPRTKTFGPRGNRGADDPAVHHPPSPAFPEPPAIPPAPALREAADRSAGQSIASQAADTPAPRQEIAAKRGRPRRPPIEPPAPAWSSIAEVLGAIGAAVAIAKLHDGPASLLIQLADGTGARLGELALAQWPQFDLAEGRPVWRFFDAKRKVPTAIELGPDALAALLELQSRAVPGDPRVFPWLRGTEHAFATFIVFVRRHRLGRLAFADFGAWHETRHSPATRSIRTPPTPSDKYKEIP